MMELTSALISDVESLSEESFDGVLTQFLHSKYQENRLGDIGKYLIPRKVIAVTFNSSVIECRLASPNCSCGVIVKYANIDSVQENQELITEYHVSQLIYGSDIECKDNFERVYFGNRVPFTPFITQTQNYEQMILPIYDCESAAQRRVDRGGMHGTISVKRRYVGQTLTLFVSRSLYSDEIKTSVIVRSLLACHEAYNKLEFVHNDLHGGNIMIVETKEKHVRYVVNGRDVYLKTHGWKPVIIDLARSAHSGSKEPGDDDNLFPIQINGTRNPMNDVITLIVLGFAQCDAMTRIANVALHDCLIASNYHYQCPTPYADIIELVLSCVEQLSSATIRIPLVSGLTKYHANHRTDFAMLGLITPEYQCTRESYTTLLNDVMERLFDDEDHFNDSVREALDLELTGLPITVISKATKKYTKLRRREYKLAKEEWNKFNDVLPIIRVLEMAYMAYRKGYGDVIVYDTVTTEELLLRNEPIISKLATAYDNLSDSLRVYDGALSSTPYTILRMLKSICDIYLDVMDVIA